MYIRFVSKRKDVVRRYIIARAEDRQTDRRGPGKERRKVFPAELTDKATTVVGVHSLLSPSQILHHRRSSRFACPQLSDRQRHDTFSVYMSVFFPS